jgi:hypothetical protein
MREVGGLVGRRVVGGLGWVGASQKKLGGVRGEPNKSDKKIVPRKKKKN